MSDETINITLKAFEPKDMAAALSLGQTYFESGHHCLDAAYLDWLYLRNPAGPAVMAIAAIGDRWVGMMALVPVWLRCGPSRQLVRYAVNVVADPAFRGRNIFINLIKATREQLAREGVWLIGHPNAVALPGWRRQKMAFCEPLRPCLVLPLPALGQGRLRTITLPMLREVEAVRSTSHQAWQIDHNLDYLQWRYFDPPHRRYALRMLERSGALTPHLRVERAFRFGVNLMVDWTTRESVLAGSGLMPHLVMLPASVIQEFSTKRLVPLSEKRNVPFFVSTWGGNDGESSVPFSHITLGASDF